MALENGLMIADVVHERLSPKNHKLQYKVYYLSFALDRIHELKNRLFSLGKFNLFSFYEKDYGFNSSTVDSWIRSVLETWNIASANGDIVLVTMPRILGYAFNPVSFWFCLDKKGNVRAVLAEVNNTFGERHAYICFHEDQRPIEKDDILTSQKVFHVSPFFKVEGEYQFRFAYSEKVIGVWIDYFINHQKVLITSVVGRRMQLNQRNLLYVFVKYPLVTIKVIALIHYHALRLVLKGITYIRKPKPPQREITR